MAGFPGETFLEHIRGTYHWIAQEFEYLYSQVQGFLSQEHKDDGRHGVITADKLSITSADWFIRFFHPQESRKLLQWENDHPVPGQRRVTLNLDAAVYYETRFPYLTSYSAVTLMELRNAPQLSARGAKRAGFVWGSSLGETPWALGPQDGTSYSIGAKDGLGFFDFDGKYVFGIIKDPAFVGSPGGNYLVAPNANHSSVTPVFLGHRGFANSAMLWESIEGKLLYGRDGVQERGRTVGMGEWIAPPFIAGNFRGTGAMTWTVAAGDVGTYTYTLVGKAMTISFYLSATTVGGTPAPTVQMAIPGGFVAARSTANPVVLIDAGVRAVGMVFSVVGAAWLDVWRLDAGNFGLSTDNTYVLGQITFEVQ